MMYVMYRLIICVKTPYICSVGLAQECPCSRTHLSASVGCLWRVSLRMQSYAFSGRIHSYDTALVQRKTYFAQKGSSDYSLTDISTRRNFPKMVFPCVKVMPKTHCGAQAVAAWCDGLRNVVRQASQRGAFIRGLAGGALMLCRKAALLRRGSSRSCSYLRTSFPAASMRLGLLPIIIKTYCSSRSELRVMRPRRSSYETLQSKYSVPSPVGRWKRRADVPLG